MTSRTMLRAIAPPAFLLILTTTGAFAQSAPTAPKAPDAAPKVHGLAVTSDGYSLRFGFDGFREVSTRSGRKYARPAEGAEVMLAAIVSGSEIVICASRERRVLFRNPYRVPIGH